MPARYEKCGGRSLTSRLTADEVDPTCDPLDPGAKFVIATGLLTGTPAPNVGRLSAGGKSPLTGTIKEANVGGRASTLLAMNGIRAVVVEGKADELHLLVIEEGKARLVPCPEYEGLGNYALCDRLYARFGTNIGVVSIGPAGERGYRSSTVAVNDIQGYPSRHAARGGLGAVMGAKGLKALVVMPTGTNHVEVKDLPAFRAVAKPLAKQLATSKKVFSTFGTAMTIEAMNERQGLPTQNFRRGVFKEVDKISGEALHQLITKREGARNRLACSPTCVIRCSNLVVDEAGNHVTSSLEYETMCLNGSNLLISDLDTLARIDHECDDIGIDTIETGGTIGVAMEAGLLDWGDGDAVLALLQEIRDGTDRGELIARGVKRAGQELGVRRVPHVKGQGLPAYDPRVAKGMGVTFATSPMGADHTAGAAIPNRKARADTDYGEFSEDRMKAELSHDLQVYTMMMDSLGFCYFVGPSRETMATVAELLNAKNGWALSREDVVAIARESLRVERDFNQRAGFTARDDDLPAFFREEASEPMGTKWTIPAEDLAHLWDDLD